MSQTDVLYLRVRITGVLTCLSPLHIGSGEPETLAERRFGKHNPETPEDAETSQYDAVCLNAGGLPYLPGSSLRGFLRSQAERRCPNTLFRKLFGHVDSPKPGDAEKPKAYYGALRVYDAVYQNGPSPEHNRKWDDNRHTMIRQSVAIEPITLTADANEHKLFSYEYVPADSHFDFRLEAEELDARELETLLGLLNTWDGGPASTIGRGASRFQGRLKWHESDKGKYVVKVLEQANVRKWLDADHPLKESFHKPTVNFKPDKLPASGLESVKLHIIPSAPMLVNDPGYVQPKPKDAPGEPKQNRTPDLQYSRTADGKPMIPAASLRGLVRGRARRILATLLTGRGKDLDRAGNLAEAMIQRLFGKEDSRSMIFLGDAVVEAPTTQEHTQYFNAIDRFTGGVSEHKFYQVCARLKGDYVGMASLDLERLKRQEPGEWWKGLLLLVLRDALEGDLAVGWGKARGYGAFHCHLDIGNVSVNDWPALLNHLQKGKRDAQAWIEALHTEVDRIAAANPTMEESGS